MDRPETGAAGRLRGSPSPQLHGYRRETN